MISGASGYDRCHVRPTRRRCAHEAEEAAASIPAEASHVRSEHWFQRFARLGLTTRARYLFLLAYIAADILSATVRRRRRTVPGRSARSAGNRPAASFSACWRWDWPGTRSGEWPRALSREDKEEKRPSTGGQGAHHVQRAGWTVHCNCVLFLVRPRRGAGGVGE